MRQYDVQQRCALAVRRVQRQLKARYKECTDAAGGDDGDEEARQHVAAAWYLAAYAPQAAAAVDGPLAAAAAARGPPQLLSFAWVSLEELRSLKQENARRPPVVRWRQCAEARPDGATLSHDELQWAELWDGLHAALREIHAAHAPPGAASDAAASAARLGLPD